MSFNAKATVAFLLTLVGLLVVYGMARDRLLDTRQASPDLATTATPALPTTATPALRPASAVTDQPVTVGVGGATLAGTVFSASPAVDVAFRYGTDPSLETATTTIGAAMVKQGDYTAEANAQLRDLKLGSRYFYRLEFRNDSGAYRGSTYSFLLGGELLVHHRTAVVPQTTGSVDFRASIGTTTTPKTFTITNTGDLDAEDIVVSVDGDAAGEFLVSGLSATTLAPSSETTFSIAFTPTSPGERRVTLKIESATATTFEVTLVGEGATVWAGPVITFINTCASCSTDQITPNVAITRGASSGIFNSAAETQSAGKEGLSPIGTEWAYGTTAELGDLDFRPWFEWLGFKSPARAVDQNAVLHLITEDIYVDIRFASWADGEDTGGFSYTRTTPDQ